MTRGCTPIKMEESKVLPTFNKHSSYTRRHAGARETAKGGTWLKQMEGLGVGVGAVGAGQVGKQFHNEFSLLLRMHEGAPEAAERLRGGFPSHKSLCEKGPVRCPHTPRPREPERSLLRLVIQNPFNSQATSLLGPASPLE